MKAMILAAGLGTRLRPLTNNKPKALVELAGKTLLEHSVEKLISAGVKDIVINVHHFHDMMKEFISGLDYGKVNLQISDEKDLLLDTGGGLWNARSFFDDGMPFLLINVDIVSDIDLKALYKSHVEKHALATLAVSTRKSTRTFLWENGRLCGWRNNNTGEEILSYQPQNTPQQLAFSGIHCISPGIFKLYQGHDVFSIKDVYLELASIQAIKPFLHDAACWFDTGTVETLNNAAKYLEGKYKSI